MGMDAGHMPFGRMAKAIPPAYASYLFGFMVRHTLKSKFGISAPSWDEAQEDLPRERRRMNHLLRGAGSTNPVQGVELVRNLKERSGEVAEIGGPSSTETTAELDTELACLGVDSQEGGEQWAEVRWSITRLAAREIELSFAGGCDTVLGPAESWLGELRPVKRPPLLEDGEGLDGRNTFVMLGRHDVKEGAVALRRAIEREPRTRAVVVCEPADEEVWRAALEGAARVVKVMELGGRESIGGAPATELLKGLDRAIVLAINERRAGGQQGAFDREAVRSLMDPLDTGEAKLPSAWKNAVSYSPYPDLRPENWEGKGFPDRIMRLVREGAEIKPLDEPESQQVRPGEVADPRSVDCFVLTRYGTVLINLGLGFNVGTCL